MSRPLPIREASVVLASMLFGVGTAAVSAQAPSTTQGAAQSSLPAAQPTTGPAANQTASSSASSAPVTKPEARLEVDFAGGMLTVNASNASLNQVLRQVSQKTGMKVTGTVADESVFGQYGPLPVSEVLASLLDGTGSNMLLVDNKSGPAELVLTPRRGGATPPSANNSFAGNNARSDSQEQQYVAPVRPFQAPTFTGRGPVGANADGSPAFGQPPGSNTGGNPNGGDQQPKTPQQIYEQLQSQGTQQQPAPQE
jgi:hypothetical protein